MKAPTTTQVILATLTLALLLTFLGTYGYYSTGAPIEVDITMKEGQVTVITYDTYWDWVIGNEKREITEFHQFTKDQLQDQDDAHYPDPDRPF